MFTVDVKQQSNNSGLSDGATLLGKRPVPGHPTIWITVGPAAVAVGAGGGCLDILLSIFSLLFLHFCGRQSDIN